MGSRMEGAETAAPLDTVCQLISAPGARRGIRNKPDKMPAAAPST